MINIRFIRHFAARHVDNSNIPRIHRTRLALSQVEALFRLRSDSGIPSISTAYAQVRPHCAQVIHIFVHRQGSNPLAGGRRQRISPPSGTGMPVGLPVSRSLIGSASSSGSNRPRCPASTRCLRCACHKLRRDTLVPSLGPCRVRTHVRCCRDHAIYTCVTAETHRVSCRRISASTVFCLR